MITKTSLKHPVFLLKIKEAILLSIKKLNKNLPCVVDVYNSKGESCLGVIALSGGKFRVMDRDYNDLTDIVISSLREFHKGN